MILFLLTFIFVYGSIHLYLFLKVKAALALGPAITAALAFFLFLMVLAPIGVRLLDRHGLHMFSRVLAHIGYTWMGLLFFFFCLGLCLDIFNASMKLLAMFPGSPMGGLVWTGKQALWFLAVSALLLGLLSLINAWQIRLDRLSLQTTKLPANVTRVAIVHISDLHLGMLVGERRLRRIMGVVRRANPDVLVCTGDLVDAQMDHLSHLADMLAELQPPLGKFAVTGNHEYYAGIRQSTIFLQKAGFTLLRNQSFRLDDLLTIVGIDDPVGRARDQSSGEAYEREVALLPASNSPTYTILLKHRPAVEVNSLGRFDLQLSGHTHRGQIYPFTLLAKFSYPRQDGLYSLEGGSLLHVSRGAGTWGPPMRFLSSPHVTLIELNQPAQSPSRSDSPT
ncbi:MAG: metallophosphoesterase [Deltaproteobacteria bacterium]|nr:MAG: metallophosphoesterase [Deltaproteobacteria bacterium]